MGPRMRKMRILPWWRGISVPAAYVVRHTIDPKTLSAEPGARPVSADDAAFLEVRQDLAGGFFQCFGPRIYNDFRIERLFVGR